MSLWPRPSRVSDAWLEALVVDGRRALYPEVQSMARELLEARRATKPATGETKSPIDATKPATGGPKSLRRETERSISETLREARRRRIMGRDWTDIQ